MKTVFVVTRFASSTNQRIRHLLELEETGLKTVLVYQPHGRPERQLSGYRSVEVRRGSGLAGLVRAALAWLSGLELGGRDYFSTGQRIYLGLFKSALVRAIRREQAAGNEVVVVIAVPPPELTAIAPAIKRRFPDVRLLIDWQDLWSVDDNYVHQGGRRSEAARRLETAAIAAADVNVTSNPVQGRLQRRIAPPHLADGRFTSIVHAYDGADAAPRRTPGSAAQRTVRITFLGNLFKPPKVPGDTLMDLLSQAREAGADLSLTIVGDQLLGLDPQALAAMPDWVTYVPRVSHQEAVRHLEESDWALLLLGDISITRTIMPAKLAFYLASGCPILAVVPEDSYVADVVRDCRAGAVVPPVASACPQMAQALKSPAPGALSGDGRAIARFNLPTFKDRWRSIINNA